MRVGNRDRADACAAGALRQAIRLNYGQKIYLLATLPLILAAAAIALLVAYQSRELAEREIAGWRRS